MQQQARHWLLGPTPLPHDHVVQQRTASLAAHYERDLEPMPPACLRHCDERLEASPRRSRLEGLPIADPREAILGVEHLNGEHRRTTGAVAPRPERDGQLVEADIEAWQPGLALQMELATCCRLEGARDHDASAAATALAAISGRRRADRLKGQLHLPFLGLGGTQRHLLRLGPGPCEIEIREQRAQGRRRRRRVRRGHRRGAH